ncbi:MAG TPA: hypothetical protein VGO24_07805 [Solirubrobacterales bacterium]|nr:hypothetical protein [Solirubrobacterales bacterium]
MPTREQVLRLLDAGHSYETAASELGIGPGLAFMIATGRPADGSDVPSEEELASKRVLEGSSQQLVNPPASTPTRNREVMAWVRERAERELAQP